MSEEMFRAVVLIFMLALFFYIGMIFGQISAYHHIQHKIYKMEMFGNHMRYEKEYNMPENMRFPREEPVPQDDVLPIIEDEVNPS